MEKLRAYQLAREMDKLRLEFVADGTEETFGQYFDANIVTARRLLSMSDADLLLLLRIGIAQNLPLVRTMEFQTCQSRGRWYGRRLWLRDRYTQLTDGTF